MTKQVSQPNGLFKAQTLAVVHQADGDGHEINYLTVGQVTKLFPPWRNGRPLHVNTVTRWITIGVRLREGGRLRLRATRAPFGWLVEPLDVEVFLAALTADRAGESQRPLLTVPAARTRRRREDIQRELDRAGLGPGPRGR